MSTTKARDETELSLRLLSIEKKVVVSESPSSSPEIEVRSDDEDDAGGSGEADHDDHPPTTDPNVGPFRVGEIIAGTFEITGILGFGGMGVVYEALDRRLLRRVAIKTARQSEHTEALLREAQGLVAISNPSFVRVHAMMEHGGVDFLVLERLYGETLEERLASLKATGARMAITDAIDVLAAIADALSNAHRAGVAQRDLKPSNIMLLRDGRIVLLDLGLFLPETLVGPSNLPAGSLEYMAPEVVLSDVKRGQGPLIDLYSLGIVAFELLTNRTPFGARSTAAGPIHSILLAHVTEAVPDIAEERPDAPRALLALINELLAKKAEDRPPSAEAVLWQLIALKEDGRRMPSMNVLAVDDDPHVGKALKRSLESAFPKLHVDATTDSRKVVGGWLETLSQAQLRSQSQSHTPTHDVVLVDLNMPHHNGIDVCMALLTLPPEVRPIVVAMSAEAKTQDIEVLKGLGVRHFVAKDDAFVKAMSSVIGAVRATKLHHG